MKTNKEFIEYLGINETPRLYTRQQQIDFETIAKELKCEYCLNGDFGIYLQGIKVMEYKGITFFKESEDK